MALLVLFGSATAANASHVSCGGTIDTDTTLDADLQCPDRGLEIGASGVTLDLAGHTIEGSKREVGVVTAEGVTRVTIKNGSVGRFYYAILLKPGVGDVIRNVHGYDSHEGILLDSVTGTLLDRITATGNDSGVRVRGSRNVTLRRSHVHDNAAGVGGVGLSESRFVRNVIARNTFYGMRFVSVTNTSFERNVVSGNGEFGIALEGGSAANRVVRNRVSQTAGDGISLADDSGANLLQGNHSSRNTGEGIALLGAGATLIRNFAARNGKLGIDAPAGAALARHNVARRNGDTRECVGVSCRGPGL